MNVLRNLVNRIRGWLPKEPLSSQVKPIGFKEKGNKPNKNRMIMSFVAIFVVVFSTLSILEVLGLQSYAPFVAGAIAALASALFSVFVWKPRNQGGAKSSEMNKELEQ